MTTSPGRRDPFRPRRSYRALDLFCGGGGCSVGYVRAGFDEVHGVDVAVQQQYPFFSVEQASAFDVLADVAFCRSFDFIHASPPCKDWTSLAKLTGGDGSGWMLEATRDALERIGVPYVIENVVGAPLRDPVMLCGSMFGLGLGDRVVKRHRLFESNMPLTAPADACSGRPVVGVYGTGGAWTRIAPGGGGVKVSGADAARALGVDWTDHQPVLSQMVPPAFTEFLGRQVIAHLEEAAA
jgi:DNA (cytosine-5)-methyltransferase 1